MFFESIVNFFQLVVKYFKSILFKEVKVEVKVEVQILLSPEEKYINDIEKKFQESYENKNVEWSGNIYEKEDAIPQNHGVKLLQSMNYDQLKSMTDIKKEFFPAFFAIIRGITKQSNK
jgi:hypothetical protein